MTVSVSVAMPLKLTLPFMIKASRNICLHIWMRPSAFKLEERFHFDKWNMVTKYSTAFESDVLFCKFVNIHRFYILIRTMKFRLCLVWSSRRILMKAWKVIEDVMHLLFGNALFSGHQSILDHIMIKLWDNNEKISTCRVVDIKNCR